MPNTTSKERVEAAFRGEFTDRIPSCPIVTQSNILLTDATLREYLTDSKTMAEAQIAGYERYKPDILTMKSDALIEAEALGNRLRFPEDAICYSIEGALEKDKSRLKGLGIPDPKNDGRMKSYLEAVSQVRETVIDAEMMVFLNGPWNIAINIRRAELLLEDAREDPSFFKALMDFTTQVSLTFGEAVLPLKVRICYSECLASSSYISYELYRRLVLPYHKRITNHFERKGTGVGLHICGYANPILNDIMESGASFVSIDSPTDLAKAVEVAGGRTVLMGNINPNLFSYGSRENLREAIETSINKAGNKGGYILASGCEIPSNAAPDRVSWFMELAEELG